jgi:hypothetical protein
VTAAEPAEAVVGTVIGRAWHGRRTDSRALRDARWTVGTRHAWRRGRIRSVHARHTRHPRCLRSLHARHTRCVRSLQSRHVPWRVGGIRG